MPDKQEVLSYATNHEKSYGGVGGREGERGGGVIGGRKKKVIVVMGH